VCQRIDDGHIRAWHQRQVIVGLDVWRFDQSDASWVDDDELRARAQASLHLRCEHRVCNRRVGANGDNYVGIHDAVERLCSCRSAERLFEAITSRRVTHSCAGVDIVITHGGANEFLHNEYFLVGTTRRRNAADRFSSVFFLNFLETFSRVADRLVPTDLAPRVFNIVPNHRV